MRAESADPTEIGNVDLMGAPSILTLCVSSVSYGAKWSLKIVKTASEAKIVVCFTVTMANVMRTERGCEGRERRDRSRTELPTSKEEGTVFKTPCFCNPNLCQSAPVSSSFTLLTTQELDFFAKIILIYGDDADSLRDTGSFSVLEVNAQLRSVHRADSAHDQIEESDQLCC
ncbi:hypothetical protein EGR_06926 [Echinococcus granulosus]|uniref:Uncharacterized protein n=1 Tax=Echinococcus granulosus TaxID=6210 RepID=W6UJ52_ECHGR|nr:hypothetical protein EGR_06926 [Echinococcus granulosus]EUB58182.1 hypothetical protein EGR_06926 [Echinococcus granulosus]